MDRKQLDKKQYELITKVHNELLNRKRIKADKYEREDSFFGAVFEIEKGADMKEALIKSFNLVYGIEISDLIYDSCYAVCKGFRQKDGGK